MDTKKLRQKILDLAIRGKLVPQDPNDEPASVLLERIKAEKERLIKEGKIKRSKKSASDTSHYQNRCPNGWICVSLNELCSAFSTGPFGSMVHKSDYVEKGGIPLINPINISNGKVSEKCIMMVSEEKASELRRYKLKRNDIVIARRGDLSKCAVITEKEEGWLCGTGSFFLHIPLVEPQFFEFFYLSDYVQSKLEKECVGATMSNLNQGVLGNIPFMLPPYEEQKRILNEAKRWFSLIDILKENQVDLFDLIDEAKKKIQNLAIHGELVPQNQDDTPAIDFLKRINPSIDIPCDNPHYQNIPQSWCICTMADIAVSELGKTLDKEKNKGEYKPYLCSANVLWNRFDLSGLKQMRFEDDETDRYSIKKNDLIICEGGDAGRCAVWTSDDTIMFQNALHRVRFYHGISPYYIMYVLMFLKQNGLLEEYCKGVTIKHFTKTALSSLQIPLPPIGEQYRIVSKIEEYFCILSNIKTAIK